MHIYLCCLKLYFREFSKISHPLWGDFFCEKASLRHNGTILYLISQILALEADACNHDQVADSIQRTVEKFDKINAVVRVIFTGGGGGFCGSLEILYSFDPYILAKMRKMSYFDPYFSSKLGKMYSFDPLFFTLVAFRVDGRWWASLSETWPSTSIFKVFLKINLAG